MAINGGDAALPRTSCLFTPVQTGNFAREVLLICTKYHRDHHTTVDRIAKVDVIWQLDITTLCRDFSQFAYSFYRPILRRYQFKEFF